MNNRYRVWFFRHYYLIIPLVACILALLVWLLSRPDNFPGNLLALSTVALGAIYFVQKQKADDLQMFERLFAKFNERYDKMQPEMQLVLAGQNKDICRDRNTLDAYFNLCAEEYLFFREGRILPRVWQAWCQGMLFYLAHDRVKTYWENEQKQDTHYGLTSDIIKLGAETRPV